VRKVVHIRENERGKYPEVLDEKKKLGGGTQN
jgi:hypothetical protein